MSNPRYPYYLDLLMLVYGIQLVHQDYASTYPTQIYEYTYIHNG
jgi:hypothetical protein